MSLGPDRNRRQLQWGQHAIPSYLADRRRFNAPARNLVRRKGGRGQAHDAAVRLLTCRLCYTSCERAAIGLRGNPLKGDHVDIHVGVSSISFVSWKGQRSNMAKKKSSVTCAASVTQSQ